MKLFKIVGNSTYLNKYRLEKDDQYVTYKNLSDLFDDSYCSQWYSYTSTAENIQAFTLIYNGTIEEIKHYIEKNLPEELI